MATSVQNLKLLALAGPEIEGDKNLGMVYHT